MSALGHKQTSAPQNVMSAYPRKLTCAVQLGMSALGQKWTLPARKKAANFGPLADIGSTRRDVCFSPRKTVRGPWAPAHDLPC
jgi:hypothetical protein